MASQPHRASDTRMAVSALEPTISGRRATMENLPTELLHHIVNFCEGSEPKYLPKKKSVVHSLSLVNKMFRAICIPKLFPKLSINIPEHELHIALEQMAASADITPVVRAVSIQPHNIPESIFSEEPYICHESFPAAMFRLLNTLPNLVEVRLKLWGENSMSSSIRAYTKDHNAVLPHVKSLKLLIPSSMALFLTDVFCNITTLHIQLHSRTVGLGALKSLAKLEALSVERDGGVRGWRLDDVEHFQRLVPDIRWLILLRELDETAVSSLIDTIAQFPKLEHLAIPCYQLVHPDSMFMDMDYIDEMYDLRENHPLNEDNNENAEMLFLQCPRLKRVAFFTPLDPIIFVSVGDGENAEVREVIELFGTEQAYLASDQYWDGTLAAAF